MIKKISQMIVLVVLIVFAVISVLIVFKGNFYIYVYDEQTKEFLDMGYEDIETKLNAQWLVHQVQVKADTMFLNR